MWNPNDDYSGGALVSGTYMVTGTPARLEETQAQQLLFAQGLETDKLYDIMIRPIESGIYERDEITVSYPSDHYLYNIPLRVVAVTKDSLPKKNRGHWEILAKKVTRSRKKA